MCHKTDHQAKRDATQDFAQEQGNAVSQTHL